MVNILSMEDRMREVNKISPTMCLAKWVQSTVHLHNGHTHSCHHPRSHKVPLHELQGNPSALHNTEHKKWARQDLLDGIQTPECEYCWNIENMGDEYVSDRTYKSVDAEWAFPHLDEIVKAGADDNVNPTYLEVAFETTCNFKCAYCGPDVSSKWMEEINQHGPYPTSKKSGSIDWLEHVGKMPIPNRDHNPYLDAFWEWWPELYQSLRVFRVTGGEPLLSKTLWELLDYIEENPREDFALIINTNMDVPEYLIDRLIQKYNAIAPNIKYFDIYTSCEAHGEQAEYIRYGMDYERFMNNVKRFLTETDETSRVHFMIAFNALSVTSFDRFLVDIYGLRMQFNQTEELNRIPLMISYVRGPQFLDCRILPTGIKRDFMNQCLAVMKAKDEASTHGEMGKFYADEIDQLNRLGEFMRGTTGDLTTDHADFAAFINEYDNRRGLSFAKTFPELTGMIK